MSCLRVGFFLGAVALAGGCGSAPQVRGQIAGLRHLADQAERQGAKACAPRELAVARANLEFAELSLAEGSVRLAEEHLLTAEINARSALLQSPAQYCGNVPPQAQDRDGDGYLDPADRCPEVPENFNGFEDDDGCPDDPDTDGDSLKDSLDVCVILPEDLDLYLDGDGCPEVDNDLDGLVDTADGCPLISEDPDGYEDDDGCPDPDNDGDAVLDVNDECPSTPGQTKKTPLGCPIESALVFITDCEVKITEQIHFTTGKDIIQKDSYPVLDAVSEVLESNPSIKLQIEGHTDDVGANRANLDLSERRATSVRKYLVAHGVEISRLESRGYGEERPLVENISKENRALNRRVQFMRTEGQKADCGEAKKSEESASSPPSDGSAR